MEKSEKERAILVILNDRGLHTRPSTELAKCASSFESEISLRYHQMKVDAKSLIDILMLAAPRGAKIEVEAEGLDAKEAIDAILELGKNKFCIHY